MKILRFQGFPDGTFGELLVLDEAHDNDGAPFPICYRVASKRKAFSIIVFGYFAPWPSACWGIGIAPEYVRVSDPERGCTEEFMPPLSMHWGLTKRTKTWLEIKVPDDTTVERAST